MMEVKDVCLQGKHQVSKIVYCRGVSLRWLKASGKDREGKKMIVPGAQRFDTKKPYLCGGMTSLSRFSRWENESAA